MKNSLFMGASGFFGVTQIFGKNPENLWEDSYDVIVVGSGFAGLAASIEARKNKCSVLLIEKMDSYGGNSALCAGDMAVPNSPVQKACGIIGDSPQVMLNDLIRAGGEIDLEHAEAVCQNALSTWQWTIDELGVDWVTNAIQNDLGQSFPRGIMLKGRSGAQIVQAEIDSAERLKVEMHSSTRLEKILLDNYGSVCGIEVREGYIFPVEDSGKIVRLKANKGVILATGGFSADIEFRSFCDPRLTSKLPTSNHPGATAEALKAAMKIGAKTVDLNEIQVMSWNSSEEIFLGQSWAFIEYVTLPFGIWLSTETGKAICLSNASHKERTEALLELTGKGEEAVAIVSRRHCVLSGFDQKEISSLIKQGIIHHYSSLGEMALDLDIPAQTLNNTVRARSNNKDVVNDDWYVIFLAPKVHHCMGGLSINGLAKVRSSHGGFIQNFYAAGEVCGGLFGKARLPSHSCTDALVMGKIAGKSASLKL